MLTYPRFTHHTHARVQRLLQLLSWFEYTIYYRHKTPLRHCGGAASNRQHTTVTCYLWNIGDETHEGISAVLCTFTKSQWWWLGNLGLGLIIFMWNAWTPVPIVDRAGAKVYLPGAWRRSEGCQMDASILSEPNVEFDGLSIEHERAWNTNVRTGITHRVNNDTQLFVQFTAKIGWQLQPASSVATKSICALWAKKHCTDDCRFNGETMLVQTVTPLIMIYNHCRVHALAASQTAESCSSSKNLFNLSCFK